MVFSEDEWDNEQIMAQHAMIQSLEAGDESIDYSYTRLKLQFEKAQIFLPVVPIRYPNITSLEINYCQQLTDDNYDLIGSLTKLTNLTVAPLAPSRSLTFLSELTNLKKLKFSSFVGTDFSPLQNLNQLECLSMEECHFTDTTGIFDSLFLLKKLNLSACFLLTELVLPDFLNAQLVALDLCQCESIKDISAVAQLSALEFLDISLTDELVDISPVQSLTNLTSFTCSSSKYKLSDIVHMTKLESLARRSLSPEDISVLPSFTHVKSLNLSGSNIKDFSCISGMVNLETLRAVQCPNLSSLAGIENLRNLIEADLYENPKLEHIPEDLSQMTQLTTLSFFGCALLKDISMFNQLIALDSLDLSLCSVSDIAPLANLNLSFVSVEKCPVETLLPLLHHQLKNGMIFNGIPRLEELLNELESAMMETEEEIPKWVPLVISEIRKRNDY